MTYTDGGIDPQRPWIREPADNPASLRWLPALTNPMGETSRLHFTRVWTALFFSRLIVFLIPVVAGAVLAGAGAKDPQAMLPPAWLFMAFVVITALGSAVLHVRRLSDARRSPLWAVLVLIPVLAAGGGFLMGANKGATDYDTVVEANGLLSEGFDDRETALKLDRPGAIKVLADETILLLEAAVLEGGASLDGVAERLESRANDQAGVAAILSESGIDLTAEQAEALTKAIEGKLEAREKAGASSADGDNEPAALMTPARRLDEIRGERRGVAMRWRDLIPDIKVSEISQREHAFEAALGQSQAFWAVPSFLVMLWSLLWVGRLPNGGGSIKARVADMRAAGLT